MQTYPRVSPLKHSKRPVQTWTRTRQNNGGDLIFKICMLRPGQIRYIQLKKIKSTWRSEWGVCELEVLPLLQTSSYHKSSLFDKKRTTTRR